MEIHLKGNAETGEVWLNGKKLNPKPSQKYDNHSPDGFNWGYGGSGPAQLALAICIKLWGLPKKYERPSWNYQDFKWRYITTLPFQEDFDITIDITDFLTKNKIDHESN